VVKTFLTSRMIPKHLTGSEVPKWEIRLALSVAKIKHRSQYLWTFGL